MPEPSARLRPVAAYKLYRELLDADYRRDNGPESKVTLAIWRASQILRRTDGLAARLPSLLVRVLVVLWIRGLMRAELPSSVWAGPGLKLGHGGRGVILHPRVKIGDGVTIFHDVTLGVARRIDEVPTVEDDVLIAVGARALGPVTIGAGATLGANSVLLSNADPRGVYLGVPARKANSRGPTT